jgi:uncharacterized membrane protein YvbJ
MKRCTHCGRDNPDDGLYCRECGTPAGGTDSDTGQQRVAAAVGSDSFCAWAAGLKLRWLVPILGLLVLVAIATVAAR